MVRVMFYTPGFLALLLLKTGEPTSFGITVELLMLASAAAVVAGLFIGTQSTGPGADHSSRTGVWSGSLILELLAVVPFLCAVPPLFHCPRQFHSSKSFLVRFSVCPWLVQFGGMTQAIKKNAPALRQMSSAPGGGKLKFPTQGGKANLLLSPTAEN